MRFVAVLISSLLPAACQHVGALPGGDTDADTESESGSETESDPGPSDPACAVEHGGECTGLVAGCAACADGWAPFAELADCQPDEWCCVPAQEPEYECEQAGGVCVPLTEGSGGCPTGWNPVDVACAGMGAMCCMPAPTCA